MLVHAVRREKPDRMSNNRGYDMRSWQRALAIADAQLRAEYYRKLIEVAQVPVSAAREYTERATIEDMTKYLGD
jgi:hypothetical protein